MILHSSLTLDKSKRYSHQVTTQSVGAGANESLKNVDQQQDSEGIVTEVAEKPSKVHKQVHEGEMQKRRQGMAHAWQTRHFVLSNGVLSYSIKQ